jgi:hypothetical protein
VIDQAHQLVRIRRLNLHELLHCGLHQNSLALLTTQHITMLHLLTARQHDSNGSTVREHRSKSGALAILKGEGQNRPRLRPRCRLLSQGRIVPGAFGR